MIRQSVAWKGKGLENSGQLTSTLCGKKKGQRGGTSQGGGQEGGKDSEMFGLVGNK